MHAIIKGLLILLLVSSCKTSKDNVAGNWRTADRVTGLRDIALTFVQFNFDGNGTVEVTEFGRTAMFEPSPHALLKKKYVYVLQGSKLLVGEGDYEFVIHDKTLKSVRNSKIFELQKCNEKNKGRVHLIDGCVK
ncbi:hypothetical protein [uncultured Roseovarius sp.]|uniref:hypothetical protein n=1 Tax=uncultured Roseovarius sp. TaxID=293344 RepID=UPI0026018DBC|nr:hypothetical protein [uncultured Roseovarius sp.]